MAVFYCKCEDKKRFWAEFGSKANEDEHGWVYFDDDNGSVSCGECVTSCSGCGERLHCGRLTAA